MRSAFVLLALLSCTFHKAPVAQSDGRAEYLRCEYLVDPLGLDVTAPRLSWEMHDPRRGARQTAYQILVAGEPEKLAAGRGGLWDTGKVESDRTSQIVYRGRPLKSRLRCFWKVRIWDAEGKPSAWSRPAVWTMGLLEPQDIEARWIGLDTSAENEDPELQLPPAPYLRKGFRVEGKIRRATVYVSALGLFELSINGRRVGRDELTPGWTNYHQRVYYLTYDVTDLLRQGDNVIGAIVADGWYAGYVGFALLCKYPTPRAVYGKTPALWAQLEIEREDGSRRIVGTDETWKAASGPIRQADLLMGETYDATRAMPGWNRLGFDDAAWLPVAAMPPAQGKLEAYPAVTVQAIEEIEPVQINQPKPAVYVFNLGQNIAGRARLKVKGPAGTKVVLRFAEMCHADGTIMTDNLRKARCTDTYILRGDPEGEIWEPRFTYHGFQYVELSGYPGKPDLDAVTGVVLHSATPLAGSFECDHPMVNQLYRNITWTQRANFVEIPTDCPQRDERLGWTGDAQIYIRSATCNMDVASFFTKWLVALEDDQWPYGAFPDYAPLPYPHHQEYSPAWMDAGVICPYTIYQVYGDTRVIERHYNSMKRFIDFLFKNSNNYLRPADGNSWGDWLAVGGETPKDLIATAYFAYDAKLMAEMARAIGRTQDAEKFARLFGNVKKAFDRAYLDADGRIQGATQTGYALALYMDLLPENLREKAAQHLVQLIRDNNMQMATGFLGTKHLLPVLTEMGYPEVAYRLLTNTTYPSWGYSVENGATTIWERWNSYTKETGFATPSMNSFNHYAFGAVCQWMFASMAGIDTEVPGFRQIVIRPQPGTSGIAHIKAGYRSIHGRIATEWKLDQGKFLLDVTIPANTTAKVYMPTSDPNSVREGNRPAAEGEGVKLLRTEAAAAVYQVGAGQYRFEAVLSN